MRTSATWAPGEEARVAERSARRARGEAVPPTYELAVITREGQRRPLEVSVTIIELEGRPTAVTFFTDITARKQAVEELARSEERFHKLVDSAPEGVWILGGSRLRFINPAAVRMLGYPDAESVLALNPLEIVHADERDTMMARTREMLATGRPLPPREYRTLRNDGSSITVEVLSIPLEFEGQQAVLCFGRDVTARKQLEAQLAQADRLAALGTLTAGIAHEINNPLAYAMLGLERTIAAVSGSGPGPIDGDGLKALLDETRHGLDRVAAIVRQLRSFSQPHGDERTLVYLPRALNAGLRMVVNQARLRARVVTDYRDAPPVRAREEQIEQVVVNLLVNATQAIPEGESEKHEIRLALYTDAEGRAVVEVSDTGPGIPPDLLPRIFDPFFTTKPTSIGSGLGLSICHSIAASHGGSITVESPPGQGTRFRVTLPPALPVGSAPPPEPAAPQKTAASGRAAPRLLIVDDEPILAAMLREALSDRYDVTAVLDGREALESLFRSPGYDVVLCDLMMAGMTGMDLHGEVARRSPGLERRFVFMTGGAFTPKAASFLAKTGNARVDKPLNLEALRSTLDSVLGRQAVPSDLAALR